MLKKLFKSDDKEEEKTRDLPAVAAPVEAPQEASAREQAPTAPGAQAVAAMAAVVATGGVAASSEWMTTLISKMWPYVSEAVEKQVQAMVPGIIAANKPKWMEGIEIAKFKLGPVPPKITFINVDQNNDDLVDDIRMEIGFDWKSEADIDLVVKPLPEGMPKLIKWAGSIHAGVEDLACKATTVVTLVPMVGVIPVVRAAQVCLREQPDVDFHITFTSGQVGILNLLKPFIKNIIRMIVASFVYPEHICVKLDPTVPDYFKPEGLLVVKVLEAKNLPSSDWFSRGDPFVELSVRDKWKKRTTVKEGKNPKWGEEFEFMVHSRRFQHLSLTLLDEDSMNSADTMGVAGCTLSDLTPGEEKEMWLDLFDDGERDKKLDDAQILVKLTYLTSSLPSIKELKAAAAPAETLPPGVSTMLHGGILKVSFKDVTVPSKEQLPIMAIVTAAGKELFSGNVSAPALTPDLLTIPTMQVFDYDILAADADTTISIKLAAGKKKAPYAEFTTKLSEVKAKDPQIGITGGLFEFSSGGFGLKTDIYYHDI